MHIWFYSSILACLLLAAHSFAAELERRTFTVLVDNKPVGKSVMEIQTKDDGTVTLTAAADVQVKVLLIKYTFSFRGNEVWKENKLQRMTTNTNDDGKRLSVVLERTNAGFSLNATGKESAVTGEVYPTTYWKLPPEELRKELTLVDSDTGKVYNTKMTVVGSEKLNLAGQAVTCVHYRVTGGIQADLWYDGNERLLRQETVEQGHKTVLELSRLQRE